MSGIRSKFFNEYAREMVNYQESFENVKEKKKGTSQQQKYERIRLTS